MQTSDKMKAVVFDLDGTLLDTTKDIGLALERTLDTHFTDEQVNRFVGRGLKNALIAAAQEKGLVDPDIDALNERLLYFYRHITVICINLGIDHIIVISIAGQYGKLIHIAV